MTPTQMICGTLMLAGLVGCASEPGPAPDGDAPRLALTAPPDAPPGTCWGNAVQPAVIETVTEQIEVQPAAYAADGSVLHPAAYRTETRQEIVQERQYRWFRTPCDGDLTPDFVATLQRALSVRGFYPWPVTGELDRRTEAAIRSFQSPSGIESGTLSLASARLLGLVAVDLPGLE